MSPSRACGLAMAGAALFAGCALFPKEGAGASPAALMRRGESARQAGRIDEAARDYERAVAASLPTYGRRAEALYWAGMLRLSPEPAVRDLERGRMYLDELVTQWPRSTYREPAAIALALASDVEEGASRIATLNAQIAGSAAASASENAELAKRLDTSEAELLAARADARAAHGEAEKCRTENGGLRREIEAKDEALKKVKEVLLDWKPKR